MATRLIMSLTMALGIVLSSGCVTNPSAGNSSAETAVAGASQGPNDAALAAAVKDELARHEDLASANIGVVAEQGVIFLSGTVPSYREFNRAISVVNEVPGIKRPVNVSGLSYP